MNIMQTMSSTSTPVHVHHRLNASYPTKMNHLVLLPLHSFGWHSYDKRLVIEKTDLRLIPQASQSTSSSSDDDRGAFETILRAYSDSTKQKNPQEASPASNDADDDRLSWFGDFSPILFFLDPKTQMLKLLFKFVLFMGKNVEFVFKPVSKDGMDVGINLNLECGKNIPLGKSNSIYASHKYQGKVLVRNVNTILLGPLANLETLKLNLEERVKPLLEKIPCKGEIRGKKYAAFIYLLLSLLSVLLSLLLWRKASM